MTDYLTREDPCRVNKRSLPRVCQFCSAFTRLIHIALEPCRGCARSRARYFNNCHPFPIFAGCESLREPTTRSLSTSGCCGLSLQRVLLMNILPADAFASRRICVSDLR